MCQYFQDSACSVNTIEVHSEEFLTEGFQRRVDEILLE